MRGREIVLGVTGGIAAYKAAALCSRLVQSDAGVTVVLTEAATHFIGPVTFEALTGRPTRTDAFESREFWRGEHIGLADRADALVVAPATADFLAKMAHGIADDLLSTLVLCLDGPVLVAPAMNRVMWSKPAVQRNLARLREDGIQIVEPESGWLSCGQVGVGRMAEPDAILDRLERILAGK
ncbi:MAG: phosphopantothenoylcysteine decarboxylase [Planctomycetota bacterium]|nr:MAG: phosphopantothenoylcysteine decarboxylase [Planctomycetota bacterium]